MRRSGRKFTFVFRRNVRFGFTFLFTITSAEQRREEEGEIVVGVGVGVVGGLMNERKRWYDI